jgi:hypothetical protein
METKEKKRERLVKIYETEEIYVVTGRQKLQLLCFLNLYGTVLENVFTVYSFDCHCVISLNSEQPVPRVGKVSAASASASASASVPRLHHWFYTTCRFSLRARCIIELGSLSQEDLPKPLPIFECGLSAS